MLSTQLKHSRTRVKDVEFHKQMNNFQISNLGKLDEHNRNENIDTTFQNL